MGKDITTLEEMLFNTMFREIEERYNDVEEIYRNDVEILSLAQRLKAVKDRVNGILREVSSGKPGEDTYTTLYQVLKDVSSILYDLSIADGDQLAYVVLQAYRKLEDINSLLKTL